MGEKQQRVPPGVLGPWPAVLSPGCPRRTPHSPSRSFTPSSRRPPTSRCDPSSSPSSRWVPQPGRRGDAGVSVGIAGKGGPRGWLWGRGWQPVGLPTAPPGTRSPPGHAQPPCTPKPLAHVESHEAGAVCNKARGLAQLGTICNSLKIPFFFYLPFNFALTLHCHPSPEGFADRWHAWQCRRCRQMFKPGVACPSLAEQ